MDLVSKAFLFFFGRFIVLPNSIPAMVVYLREELKETGFDQQNDISDQVCLSIIQEAYRRAADVEADKQARYRPFYYQVEVAAKEVIAAYRGKASPDSRIKGILVFNRLI
jgi:hypothetical protein